VLEYITLLPLDTVPLPLIYYWLKTNFRKLYLIPKNRFSLEHLA